VTDSTRVTVQVTLPRELLFERGLSLEEASDALLKAFVLSLYRQDRISSGKAARLLGIHRLALIRMLAEEKIPFLDYTPEELEDEVTAVRRWRPQ
jgi:predicted HTH domain antitoxin